MAESKDPDWERKLVHELARDALAERRRQRRWGVFFKLFAVAYLVVLLVLWNPDLRLGLDGGGKGEAHTALVELKGIIAPDTEASADNIVSGLRKAFENEHSQAVILRINSPGGSPVQSSYINTEIRRLREKYPDKPLYAVVTDMCASGGYFVAAAADEIFVNEASIVGSIGVLMNGFGVQEAMRDLGVERRLLTAGEHKGIMDPFSPMSEFDQQFMQGMLERIHQQFIAVVREGRGERLKENDETFSGLFWTGAESIEMGLADQVGSAGFVAREVIEAEDIVDYSVREDLFQRLAKQMGAGAAAYLAQVAGWGSAPVMR